MRSGIVLLAILAGLGLAVAAYTVPTAAHARPPQILSRPPTTCYAAGQTCSIAPCAEFVVDRSVPLVHAVSPTPRLTRPVCSPQPSVEGQRLYVGR